MLSAPSPSTAASAPPTIIHLVADDLGYHDTNWRNHQVSTDALDALVKVGVEIPDFYVYKMCAPSRGSVMVRLSAGPCRSAASSSVRLASAPCMRMCCYYMPTDRQVPVARRLL